jgi:hypothetical protein
MFLSDYCHFKEPAISIPISFWIAATFIFDTFDSFPYMCITARTKRAGKTRLSELISFTCQNPFSVAAASAASLFRAIQDNNPTIIWDEAETLSSESASVIRALLNVGYRKGQTIPRASGGGIVQYETYCPKVFVLIGDIYDTLRDRSIMVEMERADPSILTSKKRFSYETAKAEGFELAEEIKKLIGDNLECIQSFYISETLGFLTDRDEEIWRPLFAICRAVDIETYTSMQRIAADLAAEKTNPYRYVENLNDESKKQTEEYGLILLRDVLSVCKKSVPGIGKFSKAIPSADLLGILKDIPTSPWRKYHSPAEVRGGNGKVDEGSGLTVVQMCYMLNQFGIHPKLQRQGEKVFRGYTVSQIEDAAKKYKVTQ